MGDVIEAKQKLREIAVELDERSRQLGKANVAFRPVQEAYEEFMRDFKAGLFQEAKESETRMPSKDMQEILALKEMPKDFRGKHYELSERRAGLMQRISDLKHEADSWRSILSAEKTELQALA